MDGQEDIWPQTVADGHPGGEVAGERAVGQAEEIHVRRAGEANLGAGPLQHSMQVQSHAQVDLGLGETAPAHGAAKIAAVPGVDEDLSVPERLRVQAGQAGRRIPVAGNIGPVAGDCRLRRASCQRAQQHQRCGERLLCGP